MVCQCKSNNYDDNRGGPPTVQCTNPEPNDDVVDGGRKLSLIEMLQVTHETYLMEFTNATIAFDFDNVFIDQWNNMLLLLKKKFNDWL